MTEAKAPTVSVPAEGDAAGKPNSNPLTKEFGDFVKETLDEWKVPGMSIAIIDGTETYTEGYGIATFPDTPATPDTLWYGASTTKAQVAAAIAHLIESGKYPALAKGWATPISSIIPEDFVLQDEWATKNLTLEDAICHRTGMAAFDLASFRERDGKNVTTRDTVRNLRNLPFTMQPRAQFSYNNHMYIVLSYVVETLTGKDLGATLKELIWDPLKMDSTYFDLKDAKNAPNHFAMGYSWDEETETFKDTPYMETFDSSGAGAIISTATDYAKWLRCLLDEAEPFSKKTHEDIKTPRIIARLAPPPFDLNAYGLGWQRSVFKGHPVYDHSGGMHAFGAQTYWVPDLKFGVAAFSNTSVTSNAAQDIIIWRLIQDKLGEPTEGRYSAAVKWKESLEKFEGIRRDALKNVYPDIADPPLPPTLDTSHLKGTYSHPGYGTMELREESHPEKADQKILVTDRDEMSWRYRLSFHHVSGDHWVCYQTIPSSPSKFFNGAHGAKFNVGANGKVETLGINWYNSMRGASEGLAVYKREA